MRTHIYCISLLSLSSPAMPAGAIKSPHALHATLSSARAGGSDQRVNSLSLDDHGERQAPDSHHKPHAAAAAALPVQGGACDFGSDASERSEKGGGVGGGGVENSHAEGREHSDSNTAAEAASVVGPPSAVECLLSVLESHGGALAKGSALLGYLESCRTVQVFFSAFFPCVLILLQGLCVTRVPRELSHSPGVFPFFFSRVLILLQGLCVTRGPRELSHSPGVFSFFFSRVLILLQGLCVTRGPRELSHSPGVFSFFFSRVLILLQGLCVTRGPRELSHSPGLFFSLFPPVSSDCCWMSPHTAAMYVLILLLYTSSCYICVFILLLCMCSYCCCAYAHAAAIRAHRRNLSQLLPTYVSSCYYICVLILLLCMCSYCCYAYAHAAAIRAHRRYISQVYLEGQGERGNAVIACLFFCSWTRCSYRLTQRAQILHTSAYVRIRQHTSALLATLSVASLLVLLFFGSYEC
jgi:uncharacterized membrane protein